MAADGKSPHQRHVPTHLCRLHGLTGQQLQAHTQGPRLAVQPAAGAQQRQQQRIRQLQHHEHATKGKAAGLQAPAEGGQVCLGAVTLQAAAGAAPVGAPPSCPDMWAGIT